jgi:hypothetical protein
MVFMNEINKHTIVIFIARLHQIFNYFFLVADSIFNSAAFICEKTWQNFEEIWGLRNHSKFLRCIFK